MSVTMSSSSVYSRRQTGLARRDQAQALPGVPKSFPAMRIASASSDTSSNLPMQHKLGTSTASAQSSFTTATQSLHVVSGSSVDKPRITGSSPRGWLKSNVFAPYYPFRKGTCSRLSTASSFVDEKYRESLQRHYRLLMTHIILTDDVIQQMAEEKILPETMIKDIQEADTREERNERLLKSLHLRGNKSYRHFRELMYRSGNFFVADLLWDDGEREGTLQEEELARFPGLLSCVPETHHKRLIHFLEAKIRERALLLAWKTSPGGRMQAISNKVIDYNQEKSLRETVATQEKKIQELESSLQSQVEACRELKLELSTRDQQLQQQKRDHRMALDTQTRFHDANLSTITRFKDRFVKCKRAVKELNEAVKRKLDLGTSDSDGGEGDAGGDDDVSLGALEQNVRKLLQELKHEQELSSKREEERKQVLTLLNRRYTSDPLVTVVKDVLKHEQKHRALVMRDILLLAHSLKSLSGAPNHIPNSPHAARTTCLPDPSTLDTKHFKAHLAMLKAEAEHIQKRFQWKDSEIAQQKQEILGLKQRLRHRLPLSLPPTHSTSNHSNASSSSPKSLEQPFTTPTDPILLQNDEASPINDTIVPSRTSHISNASPIPISPTQRKIATRYESKRPLKYVNFKERGAGLKPRGRSREEIIRKTMNPDPDKQLVNAERYLLEEAKLMEKEAQEDFYGQRMSPKAAPSRGEGDINGSRPKGYTVGLLPARAKKRGVHK